MVGGKTFRVQGGRVVLGIFAAATLALAACSSSGSPGTGASTTQPPQETSSTPTTTASAADKAKQDATAAYLGMWREFAVAGTTSDWQSAALGKYATGVALTNLTRGLYADHYNKLVTKGEATHDAKVASAEPADNPTKIIVTDCSDSTKALKYRADNGQLADDTPGGRRLINGQVELQGDKSWKVTDFAVREVGTC
ncbi:MULTISPECIES: hypothetical protein [Saccharothrix]|uniref:hypothetical protein n=1 Tax=Saccharothrix TaxID=2071 RepID=UPI001F5282D8|nr:hypothetical protein [Saccharothrix sp. CB00851]